MPKSLMLVILLFTSAALNAQAQLMCRDLFADQILAEALIQDLAKLRLHLDQEQAQGTSKPLLTTLKLNFNEKETELWRRYLVPKDEARSRISSAVIELQKQNQKTLNAENEERKKQEQNIGVIISGQKIIFNEIAPGGSISRPYQMAATKTTQVVWRKVIQAAIRRFPDKNGVWSDHMDPSHFKGDLKPVENVSYLDIKDWLTLLNELADHNDPVIDEIMPGHQRGQIYRLPTDVEWEFVAHARGTVTGTFPFGHDLSRLKNYVWYKENSGNETHDVATLLPLMVGRSKFYDLFGNAWEWTTGLDSGSDYLHRIAFGADYSSGSERFILGKKVIVPTNTKEKTFSFRLVRSAL